VNNDFQKNGYFVVKNALHPQTLELLKTEFNMLRKCDMVCKGYDENTRYITADDQVKNSFWWYGAYCFESTMLILQNQIEEIIGKELYPCYTYARIMYKGAEMLKHKDRPSCQYSATICIDQDIENEYPLFIENYAGEVSSIILQPGDMIVYNGTELSHWREEYQGNGHMQAFIHYVDRNGPYADYKFDKRKTLGLPSIN
jgi:hypothetical protein